MRIVLPGEQQLWGGRRTKPRLGLKPIGAYLFLLLMDVLTEDVRKDVHGSTMFADGIVLSGDDETDTRRGLHDRLLNLET